MTSPRYGLLAEVQNSLCTHLILRGCSDRLAASRSSAENGVNVLVEGSCNKTIAKIISKCRNKLINYNLIMGKLESTL
jgi:hypothetical protein